MKLAHIAMGHEAVDLALGQLSPAEQVLAPPPEVASDRDTLEGLLYLQLATAGRARRALDSARTFVPGMENAHREREAALSRARDIYDQLERCGGVPADLAAMAHQEGLADA